MTDYRDLSTHNRRRPAEPVSPAFEGFLAGVTLSILVWCAVAVLVMPA